MAKKLGRRGFMRRTMAGAAGITGAAAIGMEDKQLMAHALAAPKPKPAPPAGGLPQGKIGDLEISRLICGGNLISGFAHSRDLLYVSSLLKNYFTDDKVCETFAMAEENGVNTAVLRMDDHCLRILKRYWNEMGGKIQWIAQVKAPSNDILADAKRAIDNGADAVFLHGGVCDAMVQQKRLDLMGKVLEYIKVHEIPAGLAGHMIEVPMAAEKAGLDPDFYMKTLNAKNYWSAGPVPRLDSVWAETPEQTIEFMSTVKKPWIAYKVLGAGAIRPDEGFKYAYKNGADFICAGMFDFQIRADVDYANKAIAASKDRARNWMA